MNVCIHMYDDGTGHMYSMYVCMHVCIYVCMYSMYIGRYSSSNDCMILRTIIMYFFEMYV